MKRYEFNNRTSPVDYVQVIENQHIHDTIDRHDVAMTFPCETEPEGTCGFSRCDPKLK